MTYLRMQDETGACIPWPGTGLVTEIKSKGRACTPGAVPLRPVASGLSTGARTDSSVSPPEPQCALTHESGHCSPAAFVERLIHRQQIVDEPAAPFCRPWSPSRLSRCHFRGSADGTGLRYDIMPTTRPLRGSAPWFTCVSRRLTNMCTIQGAIAGATTTSRSLATNVSMVCPSHRTGPAISHVDPVFLYLQKM